MINTEAFTMSNGLNLIAAIVSLVSFFAGAFFVFYFSDLWTSYTDNKRKKMTAELLRGILSFEDKTTPVLSGFDNQLKILKGNYFYELHTDTGYVSSFNKLGEPVITEEFLSPFSNSIDELVNESLELSRKTQSYLNQANSINSDYSNLFQSVTTKIHYEPVDKVDIKKPNPAKSIVPFKVTGDMPHPLRFSLQEAKKHSQIHSYFKVYDVRKNIYLNNERGDVNERFELH